MFEVSDEYLEDNSDGRNDQLRGVHELATCFQSLFPSYR